MRSPRNVALWRAPSPPPQQQPHTVPDCRTRPGTNEAAATQQAIVPVPASARTPAPPTRPLRAHLAQDGWELLRVRLGDCCDLLRCCLPGGIGRAGCSSGRHREGGAGQRQGRVKSQHVHEILAQGSDAAASRECCIEARVHNRRRVVFPICKARLVQGRHGHGPGEPRPAVVALAPCPSPTLQQVKQLLQPAGGLAGLAHGCDVMESSWCCWGGEAPSRSMQPQQQQANPVCPSLCSCVGVGRCVRGGRDGGRPDRMLLLLLLSRRSQPHGSWLLLFGAHIYTRPCELPANRLCKRAPPQHSICQW